MLGEPITLADRFIHWSKYLLPSPHPYVFH